MPRLAVGDHAPDFTLTTGDGATFRLSEHRGRSVVIFFFPAAMTPGCTREATDFRDAAGALEAAGFDLVGISPDAPDKLAQFAQAEGLTYPLASNPDRSVLDAYGAYGEKKLYGKTVQGVIRSTFVIDVDGLVQVARYNVRATGHVASLQRELGLD